MLRSVKFRVCLYKSNVMKVSKFLLRIVLPICLLYFFVGCNWVREKLNMPTSDDIEKKRELIVQIEKKKREKQLSDTTVNVKTVKETENIVTSSDQYDNVVVDRIDLNYKYYLIVGTFAQQKNIERCLKNLTTILDKPFAIKRADGLTMVAAGKFNNFTEACVALTDISVTYTDAWIYTNRDNK